MNVRHIIEVFKTAFRKQVKTPLGRWNLENHTQTKLKINYANEDHCGSCAEYIVQKQQLQVDKTRQQQQKEEMYMYMIGPEALPDTRDYKL